LLWPPFRFRLVASLVAKGLALEVVQGALTFEAELADGVVAFVGEFVDPSSEVAPLDVKSGFGCLGRGPGLDVAGLA
jgi:hypothetical protein